MLKMTDIKFELMRDTDVFQLIENEMLRKKSTKIYYHSIVKLSDKNTISPLDKFKN